MHFRPSDVRKEIVKWFEHFHPTKLEQRSSIWKRCILDLSVLRLEGDLIAVV